jgi:TetR/AcrR family transcriptional regulator, transcriptional repressor for nem operon
MRYPKDHKAHTHDRIVRTAAALFRENGIEQISVPTLMARAGLTHGGFYAHFPSKDALVAEAVGKGLDETTERLLAIAERREGLRSVLDAYLSRDHRDNPAQGCVLASLGPEVARGDALARRALTSRLRRLVGALRGLVGGTRRGLSAQEQATGILAAMVGAMVLARATDDDDYADEVLLSCRRFLEHNLTDAAD